MQTGPNLPSPENIVTIFDPAVGSKTFGYVTHAFTSSGTFTATQNATVEYVIVAGGGGGGNDNGGGGGAGGLVTGVTRVQQGQSYTITIGGGGSPGGNNLTGANGSNSAAFGDGAIGGGGGAGGSSGAPPGNGGSGGGTDGEYNEGPGLGTPGQGNDGGGVSPSRPVQAHGSGGGGAGVAGTAGTANVGESGNGGDGLGFTYTSTQKSYYAGGGAGAPTNDEQTVAGFGEGGLGGGGNIVNLCDGQAGTANTGGGGGGSGYETVFTGVGHRPAGAGGSGIVLIRYKSTTQKATGGTITTNNPYGDIFGDGFTTAGNPALGTNPYRMAFDGAGDYIQYQDYLTPDTGAFSVVFIFKLTGIGGRGGFFERNPGAPYNGVVLGQGGPNDWSFGVSWTNPYNSQGAVGMSYPGTGSYICDVGTWNGTNTVKAYRNGSIVNTATTGTPVSLSTQGTRDKARIASRDLNSGDLPVDVGVLIVYNKELSATEITQIYNTYKERFGI